MLSLSAKPHPHKEQFYIELGHALRAARLTAGISRADLAARCSITVTSLEKLEEGAVHVDLWLATVLADHLETNLSALLIFAEITRKMTAAHIDSFDIDGADELTPLTVQEDLMDCELCQLYSNIELVGSRRLGVHTDASDWDYVTTVAGAGLSQVWSLAQRFSLRFDLPLRPVNLGFPQLTMSAGNRGMDITAEQAQQGVTLVILPTWAYTLTKARYAAALEVIQRDYTPASIRALYFRLKKRDFRAQFQIPMIHDYQAEMGQREVAGLDI